MARSPGVLVSVPSKSKKIVQTPLVMFVMALLSRTGDWGPQAGVRGVFGVVSSCSCGFTRLSLHAARIACSRALLSETGGVRGSLVSDVTDDLAVCNAGGRRLCRFLSGPGVCGPNALADCARGVETVSAVATDSKTGLAS